MTTTTLTDQEYFEKIRPLRNPEEIKALCHQLLAQWEGKAPKTIANNLTPYNQKIKTIPGEELVLGENAYYYTTADGKYILRHLHFHRDYTGQDYQSMKSNPALKTERLENKTPVEPKSYLETASKLLLSDNPHELAIGLIAVSGRRETEILVRGKFREVTPSECPDWGNPDYVVWFRGQTKKRDYHLPESKRPEFIISTLVPASFFLKAFNRYRKMPEAKELLTIIKDSEAQIKGLRQQDKDEKVLEIEINKIASEVNKTIADRRGNSLARVTKEYFPSILLPRYGEENVTEKTFRATFARMVTFRDCPRNQYGDYDKVDPLLFASRQLGHYIKSEDGKASDEDLNHLLTSIGYFDYYINGEMFFAPTPHKPIHEKTKNIRVVESDIERIKQLQEEWELPNQQSVVTKLIQSVEELKELRNKAMELTQQLRQKEQVSQEQLDLKTMVKQLVSEAIKEELSKLQLPSLPQQVNEQPIQPKPESMPQEVKPEKDWESVADEALRDSKERGVAEEKVRRSFLALVNHNDYKTTDSANKWAIGVRSLQELAGVNHAVASRWVEAHKPLIDDHNAKHNLSQYHNQRHGKAGVKIWDVISCPWNSKSAIDNENTTVNE